MKHENKGQDKWAIIDGANALKISLKLGLFKLKFSFLQRNRLNQNKTAF